jgi:hypothetical protein
MNVNNITIVIDDGSTPVLNPDLSLYDNGTHRWIYFAYQHSTHNITISSPVIKDTTPPIIQTPHQEPPMDQVFTGQAVTVFTNITDMESGVKNASLHYTIDEMVWQTLPMIYDSVSGFYQASIPNQTVDTLVKYKILAYDNAGNSAINDNSGEFFSYLVLAIPSPIISPLVEICPAALNMKSKGNWITLYIMLPRDFRPSDINLSTLLLNDTIPAEMHPTGIEDGQFMAKFNRSNVIKYISESVSEQRLLTKVNLNLTGSLNDGTFFSGNDVVRVVHFPLNCETDPVKIAARFGSTFHNSEYDVCCDINHDLKIDTRDVSIAALIYEPYAP